jgi:hypothetical protein
MTRLHAVTNLLMLAATVALLVAVVSAMPLIAEPHEGAAGAANVVGSLCPMSGR